MVIFNKKLTLDKLVTMATNKGLSIIYEIQNFANTYLEKLSSFKVMGFSVFEFWAIYWAGGGKQGSRTKPPRQKPLGHKPPDKNPPDKNPPDKNPPDKTFFSEIL